MHNITRESSHLSDLKIGDDNYQSKSVLITKTGRDTIRMEFLPVKALGTPGPGIPYVRQTSQVELEKRVPTVYKREIF